MAQHESSLALTNPIYSDQHAAREHLEALHWPDGPVCPRCGETERLKRAGGKSTRPGVINCNACRKPFTVTVGTIFEDSKIPLNKWLLGFRLMAGSKKGISAHQLHRSLDITYKSAWFMAHRIREAMDIDNGPLGGPDAVVEVDETYVGGKAKNRATKSPAPKKPVVALVERDGRVASRHVTIPARHPCDLHHYGSDQQGSVRHSQEACRLGRSFRKHHNQAAADTAMTRYRRLTQKCPATLGFAISGSGMDVTNPANTKSVIAANPKKVAPRKPKALPRREIIKRIGTAILGQNPSWYSTAKFKMIVSTTIIMNSIDRSDHLTRSARSIIAPPRELIFAHPV